MTAIQRRYIRQRAVGVVIDLALGTLQVVWWTKDGGWWRWLFVALWFGVAVSGAGSIAYLRSHVGVRSEWDEWDRERLDRYVARRKARLRKKLH